MTPTRNQDPQRLRRKRIAAGLQQKDLAAAAGISKAHMSMVERGLANASADVLSRLADVLGCAIPDLMPPEKAAV